MELIQYCRVIGLNNFESSGGPEFPSVSMIRERIEQARSGKLPVISSTQALRLYSEAASATSDVEEVALLLAVLEHDPLHTDAWLQLLRFAPESSNSEQDLIVAAQLVDMALERMGRDKLHEVQGNFWQDFETRPYMRTRYHHAMVLMVAGKWGEAVDQWREMLVLNPNDNQSVRHPLMTCLLALSRLDEADQLFEQFKGEESHNTHYAYSRVLWWWLKGDRDAATAALFDARLQNPHTEGLLCSADALGAAPPSYSPGSEDESLCFIEFLGMAWDQHPEALDWIQEQE